jgi:hypothetical protein
VASPSAADRPATPTGPGQSSRTSPAAAGWQCQTAGSYRRLLPERPRRQSWLNPRTLWRCRNDVLARLSDPVPEERARWMVGRTDAELTVDLGSHVDRSGGVSFLLVGDTGEGDHSQYALVPALAAAAPGTAFLMICSDVVYPLGDVNDYADKFYRPYTELPVPIYAVPGNHDWYDGLHAFMYHLCGLERQPAPPPAPVGGTRRGPAAAVRRVVRRVLWRRPARPDEPAVTSMRALRAQPSQRQPVTQPGPYYVIDTGHVRLVCIDTGILGDLDQQQGEWLLRVSADPRPKILLTGKPLYVDGGCEPCPIAGAPHGWADVLAVVQEPAFNYVAVIGGDIHNYQRYPVRTGHRTVQHVVSGGGGAFMHATHLIPPIDPAVVPGVTEDEFRCYPLRRDSLAAYSQVLDGLLRRVGIRAGLAMTPAEAAGYLADRLGTTPLPARAVTPPAGTGVTRSRVAARAALLLGRGRVFHKWFSPFYDWDHPPFFKHFLRIDIRPHAATVTCYAVTGCADHETDPPVEDRIEIPLR